MLIRVVYTDGRNDMVQPFVLDRLIEEGALLSFQRATGWVVMGVDPVRRPKYQQAPYAGVDRRHLH
ncbi:GSU3473 family protein [Desulfuromonas thiophila]|uniref:GSU3473 family protein n=1 Tax=Desulfuromonas thiophila TaxID=57664 RepID=UPI0024A8C72C|nr:hypothetical protein [Desulfuromonas thiophila]